MTFSKKRLSQIFTTLGLMLYLFASANIAYKRYSSLILLTKALPGPEPLKLLETQLLDWPKGSPEKVPKSGITRLISPRVHMPWNSPHARFLRPLHFILHLFKMVTLICKSQCDYESPEKNIPKNVICHYGFFADYVKFISVNYLIAGSTYL